MIQKIQQCPHDEQMLKDCEAEGITLPKDILVQDPKTHVITLQEYLMKVEAGLMPPMHNHNIMKELAEKAAQSGDQTKFMMLEFHNFDQPQRPDTPAPQNRK